MLGLFPRLIVFQKLCVLLCCHRATGRRLLFGGTVATVKSIEQTFTLSPEVGWFLQNSPISALRCWAWLHELWQSLWSSEYCLRPLWHSCTVQWDKTWFANRRRFAEHSKPRCCDWTNAFHFDVLNSAWCYSVGCELIRRAYVTPEFKCNWMKTLMSM